MRELATQLQALYSRLSAVQKGVLIGSIVAALAGFATLLLWSSEPEYRPLFTNLTPDDAAAIVNKLKDERVPYRLLAGGSSIAVPAEQVHESRLRLASEGLPKGGGIGFELFDRANFNMTNFVQHLNYQRALQGELARTISQIGAVEQVRVHLVVPQKSVFLDEQQKPSASVVLKLRAGAQLAKPQVQGILHLVASSVEGLQPAQVTIVDTNGRLLAGGEDREGFGALSTSQLEFQQGLERELERKIQSLLERAVGPQKAMVRVSAMVDFQRVESTHEVFDPSSAVVRSEQRGTEKASGSSANPSGPPGVASNVPGAQMTPPPTANSSSETQKQNETVNYEVSKSVKRVVEPVGKIKRLSVAVLIDGSYKDGAFVPRSDAEMKRYQMLVKTAMGFDGERGDQVEVINVPFDTTPVAEAEAVSQGQGPDLLWVDLGKRVGLPMLAFLVLILFLRGLFKRVGSAAAELRLPRELPKTVAELEAEIPVAAIEEPADDGKLRDLERAKAAVKAKTIAELQERVVAQARQNPAKAAAIAREWIREP
jgi:flagellar M-ring protein FliF